MIISNSSPLIALGRIGRIDILETLFGKIYIPDSVYKETVLETTVEEQRKILLSYINADVIKVVTPTLNYAFKRKIHTGEKGVLNLAIEQKALGIIIDDKKARNEAKELGFEPALFYTSDILKNAEKLKIIESYWNIVNKLKSIGIFLPE